MSHKKKSPEFYEYYPKLFHDYFPDIDKVTIDLLSKAGFYFYQSILQLDAVIDNQENHRIFNVLDLQENAIKILSTIYEDGNNFWNLWETRKREFRKAISLEKNLWNNPSEENYNKVADMKSAFGKVAIDSLFIFSENSNNSEIYNLLLESHKYFSIGFQLYDDIIDFTEDFNKKQFNWAVYELSKTLDFSKYKYDVNILNKLFYIDGTSVILFEKSIYYLEKAKKVIEKLPPDSLWLDTICDFEKTILQTKDSVNCNYVISS